MMQSTVEHINAGLDAFTASKMSKRVTIGACFGSLVYTYLPKELMWKKEYSERIMAVLISTLN